MTSRKIYLIETFYQPIISLDVLLSNNYNLSDEEEYAAKITRIIELNLSIKKLKSSHRKIIKLVYEGYTCREIADKLHTTRNAPRRILNKLCAIINK